MSRQRAYDGVPASCPHPNVDPIGVKRPTYFRCTVCRSKLRWVPRISDPNGRWKIVEERRKA